MFRELHVDGVKKEIDKYIRESVRTFAEQDIVPKLAVIEPAMTTVRGITRTR